MLYLHFIFKSDLRVQYKLDSNNTDAPRLFFLQPEGLHIQEELWPLDNTNPGACIQRGVFIRVQCVYSHFERSINVLIPIAGRYAR